MTNIIEHHRAKYQLLPNIKTGHECSIIKILIVFFLILIVICTVLIYIFYFKIFVIKNSYSNEKDVLVSQSLRHGNIYSRNIDITSNDNNSNTTLNISTFSDKDKSTPYKLVCYLTFPKQTTDKIYEKHILSNLDADLCTHLIVGFLQINDCNISISNEETTFLKQIISLKHNNTDLKVMISIGGAGIDQGFKEMVINHKHRQIFIKSAVEFLRNFRLDGIDLDWEFPNLDNTDDPRQRQHFTQLLMEIRREIDRHTDKHKFLLSVAVAAPQTIVDISYDVQYLNDVVDFVNLMSYDFHMYTKLTPWTGINAPLFSRHSENSLFAFMNINSSANYWIQKGMDKSKIIIGLPTFGHSFTLFNSDNNGIQSPVKDYGKLGMLGFITHSEACSLIVQNGTQVMFDKDTRSPYAVNGLEWISYDDSKSLSSKTEYIKENNFGGAMILSLNSDNYSSGLCEDKKSAADTFPLTRTVKYILFDDSL